MSKLWTSSRQRLSGGSLFPHLSAPTTTRPPPRLLSPTSRSGLLLSRRGLLTLAIETSCDDTCVAILEKSKAGVARLHFNEKITSDNRAFGGVHPPTAVISHTENLAPLIQRALRALPKANNKKTGRHDGGGLCHHDGENSDGEKILLVDGHARSRPDFVSVARGPGMTSNLATGLNLAKGLAVAWDVPLLAVNHMQAHALTPRLVAALSEEGEGETEEDAVDSTSEGEGGGGGAAAKLQNPRFPFLSLLVSGGHSMLVRSQSLNDHAILADAMNIAVGDMIDKCARMIVPSEILANEDSGSGMYGPMFEEFAFPGSRESACYEYNYTAPANRGEEIKRFDSGSGWVLTPPLALMGKGEAAMSVYEFAGINGQIQKVMHAFPDMDVDMRKVLARAAMTIVFEHLTSRLVFALKADDVKLKNDTETEGQSKIKTVVLSGGVASNKFLRHVVRTMLDARGYADVELVAPPVSLCTDNAAMIAWTGMEMYEDGWRSDLGVLALRKWPLDPKAEGGGILGAGGWYKVPVAKQ
ncbi:glycoprotease family-domain-containing protein [Xylaria sp. FL1777]|nr:glycoprotease family-domain-containing protein [Xylaria sp. FL1777]